MRKKKSLIVAMAGLLSLALLILFSAQGGLWVTGAQSGENNLMVLTPTYEFNVLKQPSGLLALDKTVSSGGPNYTTEFHLYISDSGNQVIRDFNHSTGTMSVLTGTPGTTGYTNSSLASSQFNYPTGLSGTNTATHQVNGCDQWYYPPYGSPVCTQPHINRYNTQEIYVSDSQNYVMRRICAGDTQSATGNCIGQVGQVVTACGSHAKGYLDGGTFTASFASLAGVTSGYGGSSYYIVDAENHVIRSWDGTNVSTVAGTGDPGFVDGPSYVAKFMVPGKIQKDSSGNMYVADIGNNAIRKIYGGNVMTCAGGGPLEQGFVNGQGSSVKFYRPTALAINSSDGYIYIADSHNNVIRRMDTSGNVTTYAGTGTPGLVNGSLSEAQFDKPIDLVIHNGFMYISDSMNNAIRRIDMTNGTVTTYIN